MATQTPGFRVGTVDAGADLTAKQFHCVKLNGSGKFVSGSASGEKIVGILQNKPDSGEVADVMINGVSKAVAGAAIAAGAQIMANASGRVITAATTGSTIIGWALDAASADGEIISIILAPAVGVV